MIEPKSDVNLQELNTLAIASTAQYFIEVYSAEELVNAHQWTLARDLPLTILGGGSNLVLNQYVPGLVVHIAIAGIRILSDGDDWMVLEVGAGEIWHQFILKALAMGLSGIENLSLIPGTTGAAPVQNIGAYGVELKDCFLGLTAFDRTESQWKEFTRDDCQFSYRDSIFKQHAGRYLITQVRFKLPKKFNPSLDYGPLAELKTQLDTLTPKLVSDKVCEVRQQKLPNPKDIPNAGSFFKNPVITNQHYQHLLDVYPDLVAYKVDDGYKLAAGWLIDHAGFKGYRDPDTGVGMHDKQALVLVNPDRASAQDVLHLVAIIQQEIADMYQVKLEIEPVQLGELRP